jgi:hypothetical protein
MRFPIKPTMALARIGAGKLTWINPELSARVFGIKGEQSAYVGRLFGTRDIFLGLAVLSPNPAVRRNALRVGVLVDTCDCAAAVLETKAGKLTPVGSALLIGGAAAFAVLGVIALSQED